MNKGCKMGDYYRGQWWTTGSFGKKALNYEIFIIGFLKFVERKHLDSALFSAGCWAAAVERKLHRQVSMNGIATPLKNGYVRPSRSSQGDGRQEDGRYM